MLLQHTFTSYSKTMKKFENYAKVILLYTRVPFAISKGEKHRILKRIRLLLM